MTRSNTSAVGISRVIWRENHRLTHANAALHRENDRLRAEVAELESVSDALRVERDAADVLLGAAMDEVLCRDRPGDRQ
jgi:hypothetical protein